MKILYVTDHRQIAIASGGFISDYLNDLTFFGLKELFGDDVVDSTPIISLYKEYKEQIHPMYLWGGMTSFWLLEKNTADRSNIKEKIQDKYYDLIIYGAIKRCRDYYDLVSKVYPDNKVILLDGNDDSEVDQLYQKHLYFKRELRQDHKNLLPITFSYPTHYLAKPNKNKTQQYGTVIPGRKETYVFNNEKDYFEDYQKSYYGVTSKKAGWDCMRHYEIMGNYCLPYFPDMKDCPKNTLFNFPKELIIEGTELASNFDIDEYYRILDSIYDYTKNNLTTKAIAQYIIDKVQ
jgi:hypothetical protein|tara:strand:- start:494 stop:1366 length:873 start_codon:yes stop_codon:yes gene_type:complete